MTQSKSTDRAYCSELAAGEPMWGTADEVDVWLMLEYKPTWRAKVVTDNSLSETSQQWLRDTQSALAGLGLKSRVQFIRQPEVDREETHLLFAHCGRTWTRHGIGYEFLQEVDVASLVVDPESADTDSEASYFVCTNGQRDLCCARFGLPSYAALRESVGTRVWQTSHLGGHRFAPNVLTLPVGAIYGRVDPDDAAAFVEEVDAGGVDFVHLRGRSCYPKQVQAAEAMTAQADLKLLHVDGDEERAVVTFAGSGGKVRVCVEKSGEAKAVLASCGDEAAKSVFAYRQGDLA